MANKTEPLYALVVDDEIAIRRLTVRALTACHIVCDEAADGERAAELLGRRAYDVVVTDLRMPRRNGHSLAVELLGRGENRPLVIVLTGVLEPRLAADLVARGVDDIAFKPVDFTLFGAKVRALCDRRKQISRKPALAEQSHFGASSTTKSLSPVGMDEVERRLSAMTDSLPVSAGALELASFVITGSPPADEVVRRIVRDPLIAVKVLRLANDPQGSPSGQRIDNLRDAVVRVGDCQIGEWARKLSAVRALENKSLDWIDAESIFRRSAATGIVATLINPAARIGADDEGLFVASLLLPMCRALMALAFPEQYQQIVARCLESGFSIASAEREVFPTTPARAVAGTLARWNLSPRIYKPLQHAGQTYRDLATMTEPLRSKVEMLRVAELLGQFAAGSFASWDEIDFPLPETMCRLRVDNLLQIVEDARAELPPSFGAASRGQHCAEIGYFKVGVEPHDFLAAWLSSQQIKMVRVSREVACQQQPVLVNCLDVTHERLEWFLDDAIPTTARPMICNSSLPRHYESWGMVVQLPSSCGTLVKAISTAIPVSSESGKTCCT
jgi:DNA-binding response OmpR family regulator